MDAVRTNWKEIKSELRREWGAFSGAEWIAFNLNEGSIAEFFSNKSGQDKENFSS